MTDVDVFPTFHELRLQYGITLDALYAYVEQGISLEEIRQFDETGRADPYTADNLLFALSKLSGQQYLRTNVGGIILVLARPPYSPTAPQPQTKSLPTRPTLRELYVAYGLDLDWVAEAMLLDTNDVWNLLMEPLPQNREPDVETLLHLLSRYIGVSYTLDTITLVREAAIARPLYSWVVGEQSMWHGAVK